MVDIVKINTVSMSDMDDGDFMCDSDVDYDLVRLLMCKVDLFARCSPSIYSMHFFFAGTVLYMTSFSFGCMDLM